MSDFWKVLGIDPDRKDFNQARVLVGDRYGLQKDMMRAFKESGLTVVEVADALGWSTQKVRKKFLRYYSDPTLFELRLFCNVLGYRVVYTVERLEPLEDD